MQDWTQFDLYAGTQSCDIFKLTCGALFNDTSNQDIGKVANMKVAHQASYVHNHNASLVSSFWYSVTNGYDTLIYIAKPEDWAPAKVPQFAKVPALRIAMDLGYETVIYSDLDTVQGNYSIRVEPYLDEDTHLVIQSEEKFCNGVFIMRNTQWSHDFIDKWWRIGVEEDCCAEHSYDQIAFWAVLMGDKRPKRKLTQDDRETYYGLIRQNAMPGVKFVTYPVLHAAAFNEYGSSSFNAQALFYHTGHELWEYSFEEVWGRPPFCNALPGVYGWRPGLPGVR